MTTYKPTYFFGWHVENNATGRLSERTMSEAKARKLSAYLNTRAWYAADCPPSANTRSHLTVAEMTAVADRVLAEQC